MKHTPSTNQLNSASLDTQSELNWAKLDAETIEAIEETESIWANPSQALSQRGGISPRTALYL